MRDGYTLWEMLEWQREQIEKERVKQERLLELYRFAVEEENEEGGECDVYCK